MVRWLGNRPSSQPGRKIVSNSSPLAAWSVIRLMRSPDSSWAISITSETCSRKACERVERFHGADEFLEVVQPARRLRRFVGLQHVGIAAFIQHHFRQFGMRQHFRRLGPAREICGEFAKAPCAPWAAVRRSRRFRAPQPTAASSARGQKHAGCTLASPMPRLGLLTMRSKARSSSPCAIRRRYAMASRISARS